MNRKNQAHLSFGKDAPRVASFILILSFLTACGSPAPATPQFPPFILVTQDPNSSPTPTPFQPSSQDDTPVPSFTPINPVAPTDIATNTAVPTFTFAAPAPVSNTIVAQPSTSARTNYVMYATLDFGAHTLAVDETIRYYNSTAVTLSDIVLSVQPNRYNNAFVLNSISQDNTALTDYTINNQRLALNLLQSLQPNAATTLTLNFKLNIPAKRSDGLFGYDFNQVNLIDWYPFVVPYDNGWVLHDLSYFGEQLVYDSSDIELNLKTDADVIVAAGAPSEPNGEWTRYRLYGARTFTLSASNQFLVSESAVGSVVIRSYYFDGYKAAGEGVLYAVVQAIGLFNVKFAPYPYETFSVVQTDMRDGQEYDGLVFLATDFYSQYGGGAKNNLTTIGVHETAHQWWFGLVGNDQALEPWLDETMAVYSERIFYEYDYPRYDTWWWQYRVDYFGPSGYVDGSVYDFGSFRGYVNAVYLNGAHFMEDLRVRMGDDNFFRFLKDYASRFSRGHATTSDFFAVARSNTNADISDLIAEYFSGSY